MNVLHFRHGTPGTTPTSADITALHLELVKVYTGVGIGAGFPVGTNCVAATKFNDINYTVLDGSSLGQLEVFTTTAGVATGDSLPSGVSAVLTLRTAKRGRRYRGRIFLPPFSESAASTDGTVGGTVRSSLVTQWNAVMALLVPKQWWPVVASYGGGHTLKNGSVAVWAPDAELVTNVTMDDKFDSQRGRK